MQVAFGSYLNVDEPQTRVRSCQVDLTYVGRTCVGSYCMFHGLEGSVNAEAVTTQQVCKCHEKIDPAWQVMEWRARRM